MTRSNAYSNAYSLRNPYNNSESEQLSIHKISNFANILSSISTTEPYKCQLESQHHNRGKLHDRRIDRHSSRYRNNLRHYLKHREREFQPDCALSSNHR